MAERPLEGKKALVTGGQPHCRCAVAIDDLAQVRPGMSGDVGGMDRADPPGAELAESNHGPALALCSRPAGER